MEQEKPKRAYWKFAAAFVGMLAVGTVVFAVYQMQLFRARGDAAQKISDAVDQYNRDLYQKQLADHYGGATPQETLRMYIDAVDKGDYELASKYFVIEKQNEELKSLQNSPAQNIQNVQNLIKQSDFSTGSFSADKTEFALEKPLLIDFVIYPSGVWKINQI